MTRKLHYRPISCATCGKKVVRVGALAKYCEPCSADAARARSNTYARKRAAAGFKTKPRDVLGEKSALIRAGRMNSDGGSLGFERPNPDYAWLARFSIPFTWAASKNHVHSSSGFHIFKRRSAREFEAEVGKAALSALAGRKVKQNKVWVGVIVEKPNQKGDAVNVVDLVCDALKVAIGVDDRWFSLAFVDWRINKNDPQILIQIGQEDVPEAQCCSHCGRIQPFGQFGKKANTKNGIDRVCRDCKRVAREIKRATSLHSVMRLGLGEERAA